MKSATDDEFDDDDLDYVQQTLHIKNIVSGHAAVDGERNVVVVSTNTFNGNKNFTLGSVTVGKNEVVSIIII